MATSTIPRSFSIETLNTSNSFTSSTNWFYTGIYVHIPANSYYFIRGFLQFLNSIPIEAALSTSNNASLGYATISKASAGASGSCGGTCAAGYTSEAINVYLHGKYISAATNSGGIVGGYILG